VESNSAERPLHITILDELRTRIQNGDWRSGVRVPSVRQLAGEFGVSPVTISRALRALRDDGLVYSIARKGTFVVEQPSSFVSDEVDDAFRTDLAWQNALLRRPLPTRAETIVKPLLPRGSISDDIILLAGGGEISDVIPPAAIQSTWRNLHDVEAEAIISGWSPDGEEPVRSWIASYLAEGGIRASVENTIVTTGGQQALSLVAQTLMEAGDTVLVERPMYPFALSVFESLDARCIDVPVDEHGMRVDIAQDLMERFRPKLLFCVPTGQAPTGVTIPLQNRIELLDAARRFGVVILEDDHGAELSYDHLAPPSIKSLDRYGHVIFAKSFSKITLPALRIGCIVADGPIHDHLVHAKLINDRYTSTLTQLAFLRYVTSPAFRRNLDRARVFYGARRGAMLRALEQYMPPGVSWTHPTAGFYLWLTVPSGISAEDVVQRAVEHGVLVAPGGAFFVQGDPDNAVRLTFTNNDESMLEKGAKRLGIAISELLTETRSIANIHSLLRTGTDMGSGT
jgi:2-aminoadipate transaminase